MEPASIRFKNPGAMWGGNAISKKWGEQGDVVLNDGLGQGNRIAVFPSYVAGICAQIDLWRSPRYHNKRFADAIKVWSGGNNVASYIKFVKDRAPGMTEDTIMSDAMLAGPMGIQFLKAQAWHEAGKAYPAPDADWIEAQKKVFGGAVTKAPATPAKKAVVAVTTGSTATAAAVKSGMSIWTALAIGLGIALAVFLVWKFKPAAKPQEAKEPPPAIDVSHGDNVVVQPAPDPVPLSPAAVTVPIPEPAPLVLPVPGTKAEDPTGGAK